MVLTKSWLLLSIPVAVLALVLLSLAAISLLRTVRRSVVLTVPIHEEQTITFAEAGTFVLNIEGGLLSRVASGLGFAIAQQESGASIPLRSVLVRTKVSSFSRTRLELYNFYIPSPGSYSLRMSGVHSSADTNDAAVVVTRPFTISMVLHILALVGLGALFIGSLVLTGLVLVPPT